MKLYKPTFFFMS